MKAQLSAFDEQRYHFRITSGASNPRTYQVFHEVKIKKGMKAQLSAFDEQRYHFRITSGASNPRTYQVFHEVKIKKVRKRSFRLLMSNIPTSGSRAGRVILELTKYFMK
ncbi:hypothetical protein ATE92_1983 [Ulvibacter sp. MAR_2010_11]|nr:hypothetical protein ATE92_1983 [Ulvibacter sp. MAR_2010_11]